MQVCSTISAKQAAKYLGISYGLLLELVRRRAIPHNQLGRRYLFRQQSLDNWLDEQERALRNQER